MDNLYSIADLLLKGSPEVANHENYVVDGTDFLNDLALASALLSVIFAKIDDIEMSIYFVKQASFLSGIATALNLVKEQFNTRFTQTTNKAEEENLISEVASRLAKRRHAENYALAADALKFWRDNISPELSAQKAATELTRVVPLSHKRLAELVSAEKNKASRLRKPEPKR